MANAGMLAQISAISTASSFFLLLAWVIRTWPYWKARINEARKIQLDADAVLRTDLLRRIRELEEAQSADRQSFYTALSDERKRCDAELDEVRRRCSALEDENRGLQAMIRQNSSSSAQMIGRPDAVAESIAGKRERDDG